MEKPQLNQILRFIPEVTALATAGALGRSNPYVELTI
jgi:hypothetical protein